VKKLDELVSNEDGRILEIPPRLFDPYRFLIMKILYAHGPVGFSELKQDLKLSDGNLASHLRVLLRSYYVKSNKEIMGNKPRTTYFLTQSGMEAFRQMNERLSKVLTK